jgi:hypothetical protein
MKATLQSHLKEDRIIASIVDDRDLSASEAAHLLGCTECLSEKSKLEKSLFLLGNLAKHHSPEPRPQARIHLSKQRTWFARPLGWKASLASAFVLLLALSTTWYFTGSFRAPAPIQEIANGSKEGDHELMAEINRLSENAIPRTYLYITGEYDKGLSEDFIRFVAPLDDQDAIISRIQKKGQATC